MSTATLPSLERPLSRLPPSLRNGVSVGVLILAVAAANLVLVLAIRHGTSAALLIGLLPVVAVAFAALVASDRSILLFGALALPMTATQLTNPLPVPGPMTIWTSDVLAVAAVAAWLARRLFDEPGVRVPRRAMPTLHWPFVLFAVFVVLADVRGHAYYGTSLFGQPLRLIVYAAIAVAATEVSPRKAHRGLTIVFYAGTVWMLLNAAYFLATGTSQTDQTALSTGGRRVLSGEVGQDLAFALLLALLNLQIDDSARRRSLHLGIAVLATIGVVLSFTRAVYLPLALVLPVVLFRGRVFRSLFGIVPLLLPFLAIGAIVVTRTQPNLLPTFVDRITASPSKDANAQWRLKRSEVIWQQFRQSPVIGVGFGKTGFLVASDANGLPTLEPVDQISHNGILWLLAAGGIALLGSFALMLGLHIQGVWRRLKETTDPHMSVIALWSVLAVSIVLVSALASPALTLASQIMTLWALLAVPWVGMYRERPAPVEDSGAVATPTGLREVVGTGV